MTKSRGILPTKVFWTEAEKDIVRQLYPNTSNAEIIRILGRHTEKSVWGIAKKLGVKKSAGYLKLLGGQLDGKRDNGKRFKPGEKPWSAGKKFPGRTSCTSFVPGQKPSNWMPLGAHRINSSGVLDRKIKEGPNGALNWEAVHRLVWKETNGPIPPRHMIVFKDNMRTTVLEEITIDRLECIDREENARRNNQWAKNPEMMQLHILKGQIKRQVNRIAKEAENA